MALADDEVLANNPDMQNALRLSGAGLENAANEDNGPVYRVDPAFKIPVSKSTGALWSSRIDQARAKRGDVEEAWREAIRYYENDQLQHRSSKDGASGKRFQRTLSDNWSQTENVVFSNSAIMLPMLYAKNPSVEATAMNVAVNGGFAKALEAVINALLVMKEAPGINIKTKARRGILSAMLTNNSYIELGWVKKQDSSEQALNDLRKLSSELENAKTVAEIREIEGKIVALEESVYLLSPGGPTCKLRSPFSIYVDPTAQEPDHSDANWMAVEDYLPTNYIRAVFQRKSGPNAYTSIYAPTHVMQAGAKLDDINEQINTFSLFNKDEKWESGKYGYQNKRAYEAAQYTRVFYIWDKTTRRVYLFNADCWDYPIWVWDDPLKLLRFFPFYRLWFHETPEGSQPLGEVTYYLDQQDEINDIHSNISQARKWARRNVFYDKNKVSQTDVEQILKGADGTARGIDVPEGMKITDLVQTIPPPSMQYGELWNPESTLAQINRITGINDAQRGAQFKTNTTNQAINFYDKNIDIRVDDKTDAIEDWIGDFCWGLAQLLVMNWTAEDVSALVGQEHAANWKNVSDPNELRTILNVRIIGGSTDKPTSRVKREQALQMVQGLGQFANAAPGLIILVIKALEEAFPNFEISPEERAMIIKSMEQQQQKAGAGPQGGGDPAAQGQGQQGSETPVDPAQAEQLREVMSQLPPEMLQQMQQLIQSGTSPTDALRQVAAQLQQG